MNVLNLSVISVVAALAEKLINARVSIRAATRIPAIGGMGRLFMSACGSVVLLAKFGKMVDVEHPTRVQIVTAVMVYVIPNVASQAGHVRIILATALGAGTAPAIQIGHRVMVLRLYLRAIRTATARYLDVGQETNASVIVIIVLAANPSAMA